MARLKSIFQFYVEGFCHLTSVGQRLWLIILIKLFILFAVFKLIFFPNLLETRFHTDEERDDYVIEQLTR